jgi:hypothetical protein
MPQCSVSCHCELGTGFGPALEIRWPNAYFSWFHLTCGVSLRRCVHLLWACFGEKGKIVAKALNLCNIL